jgi:hypothetical protein
VKPPNESNPRPLILGLSIRGLFATGIAGGVFLY